MQPISTSGGDQDVGISRAYQGWANSGSILE
jgi:hypothetical protein